MDIKDSYLHGTVGVVKSIEIDADKLSYKLADVASTTRTITLPLATTSANGLMSSGDKAKLENLSSTTGNCVTLSTDQEITGTKTFTKQLKFTVALGTSPFTVTSTTKVDNLNSDLLDGLDKSDFVRSYLDVGANYTLGNWLGYTYASEAHGGKVTGGVISVGGSKYGFLLNGSYYLKQIYWRGFNEGIYTDWHQLAFTDSDITGNATSADKLKTKRKLWGLDFDGTADVSGNMTGVGDINIPSSNSNKFITFDSGSTRCWRLGYTGSGNGDANYLIFQSTKTGLPADGWYDALKFGCETLKATFGGTVVAPTFQGNLDGTYVNKLTGYTKATAIAALATTDTLNAALGKLEFKTDFIYNDLLGTDNDDIINKWHEIVDFIDSVKEGTDILDEFVTRKTALTITGLKIFNTESNNTPLKISRLGGSRECLNIGVDDQTAIFDLLQDEIVARYRFKGTWSNTSDGDGTKAGTALVEFSLNANNTNIYLNDGTTNYTVLHSGNYNSYSPKLDGTGATGTWGINISGSAALLEGKNADFFLRRGRMTNPSDGTDWHGAIPFILALKAAGKPLFDDVEFSSGTNNIGVYNNKQNGAVTLTRIADDLGSANSSGYILKIHYNGDAASPYLGGFYLSTSSRQNAVFAQIFRAKIPVGYKVVHNANSTGTDSQEYWLTDREGTGKWEWYCRIILCGNEGTFLDSGYVSLYGSGAVTWYLAYCSTIDLTNGNYDGLRTKYADVADSAVKLTTTSKTAWGLTYLNASGVPQSISGTMTDVGNIHMSGDIYISSNGETGLRQVLLKCGTNDMGRVAVGASGLNDGWMEIATADDGTEPIYVRQYTGAYSSIKNEAILLDASGNTYFPGKVYINNTLAATVDSIVSGIKVHDIRGTAPTPDDFPDKSIKAWFNSIDNPIGNWFSGITVKGWSDSYHVWQLGSASYNNLSGGRHLYFRTGEETTWNSWRTVLDSGNYKDIIGAGSYFKVNALTTAGDGDIYLELWRGGNASWKMLNTGGILKFQCNYITSAGSYYDVLRLDYSTGNAYIKGNTWIDGTITNNKGRFNYGLANYSGGQSVTGTIVITLPNGWSSSMNTYEIDFYEYKTYNGSANDIQHSKLYISGYNFDGDDSWHNYGYKVIGSYSKGVRLGYDGSKCIILLGNVNSTWSYPQIHLSKVITGHGNTDKWAGNYLIAVTTTESNYTKIVTLGRTLQRYTDVVADNFRGNLVGTADAAWRLKTLNGRKLASDLPSTYGDGLTIAGIGMNDGWPFSYGSVLNVKGNGGAFQLAGSWSGTMTSDNNNHPTELYLRNKRDLFDLWSTWTKVLTDKNSSVSGGGSSAGSSLTVNIGGTSKTLTIPSRLSASGGYADDAGQLAYRFDFGGGTNNGKYYYVGSITLDESWEGYHSIWSFTGLERAWSGILYIGFRVGSNTNTFSGALVEWLSLTDDSLRDSIHLVYEDTSNGRVVRIYILLKNYIHTGVSTISSGFINFVGSVVDTYLGTLYCRSVGPRASRVFLRQNKTSSGAFPLIWTDNTASDEISSLLYRSHDQLLYTPSSNTLAATLFKGSLGDGSMTIKPERNNEVNFGGTSNSTIIYFGYRATDSKPIPSKFVFGGSTGTAELVANKVTAVTLVVTPQVDTPYIFNLGGNLKLNASGFIELKRNNNDATSLTFLGTEFRPFIAANENIALGASNARWSTVYANSGNFTGRIASSLTTNTHINGNKGIAIINSTAAAGYNMLAKMNSTNGVFNIGAYHGAFNLYYTNNDTINAGTNDTSLGVTLINEAGDTILNTTHVRGALKIGSNDTRNYIAFHGTYSDAANSFNHTYIGENIWATPESSELVLFKGNDLGSSATTATDAGPDRIRHIAAAHLFLVCASRLSGTFADVCASTAPMNILAINSGNIVAFKELLPASDVALNLGSTGYRWNEVYANRFIASRAFIGNITGSAGYIDVFDTRHETITPETYKSGFRAHFQAIGTNDMSDGGSFYGLIHFRPWSDTSGGYPYQLAFTENHNLWFRKATSSTAWGSWQKIITSSNYSSTLDSRYRPKISLGYCDDYKKYVIGLHPLTNDNASANYYSYGEIYAKRNNGNGPGAFIRYHSSKKYDKTEPHVSVISQSGSAYEICTFTYNGVKYVGIILNYLANVGTLEISGYWTHTPFKVLYYEKAHGSVTETIHNSEIYNSINTNIDNLPTYGKFARPDSSDSYVLLGGGGHKALGNASGNVPINNGSKCVDLNADTVDGYHSYSLWRSDGADWNPSANITMTPTANGQEWSFDFRNKGSYTGAYWQVWDESKRGLLCVYADSGKVYAPYGFNGDLTGNADTATNADKLDGEHGSYYAVRSNSAYYYNLSGSDYFSILKDNATSFERNRLIHAYLGYGSAAFAMGWMLSGYDNSPYGGFLVNCYGDDWHLIGAKSGTWTDRKIIHEGNLSLLDSRYYTESEINTKLAGYLPLSGGTLSGVLTIQPSNISGIQQGLILHDLGAGAGESLTIKWTSKERTTGVELTADLTSPALKFNKGDGNWHTLIHSGNYNSFAPKLDGTGASGTWNINISGNAATATTTNKSKTINITADEFAKAQYSGFYNVSKSTTSNPLPDGDQGGHVAIHAAWDNGNNTAGLDLIVNDDTSSNLYFRARVGGGKIGTWKTLLDSSNYSSTLDNRYYTESEADNRFVNVTGDTMTGAVNFANNTWNNVGDDVAIGDCNNSGVLGVKSLNSNIPGFRFYNSSNTFIGQFTVDNNVAKWNGNTILDTNNAKESVGEFGYVMRKYTIDASALDVNTWYPVTIPLWYPTTRIECIVFLNSRTKPSWSTHSNGFSVRKIWEVNGSGWGTSPVNRLIYVSDSLHAYTDPVRGIGQLTNSSTEYVYVRGGGKYFFYTSHNAVPTLRTSTYTVSNLSVSPTTTAPDVIRTSVDVYQQGYTTSTSISNLPVHKQSVICTISASGTLGLDDAIPSGRELHVIIKNTSSSAITITIPSTMINVMGGNLQIDGNSYGELNILSCGSYYVRGVS